MHKNCLNRLLQIRREREEQERLEEEQQQQQQYEPEPEEQQYEQEQEQYEEEAETHYEQEPAPYEQEAEPQYEQEPAQYEEAEPQYEQEEEPPQDTGDYETEVIFNLSVSLCPLLFYSLLRKGVLKVEKVQELYMIIKQVNTLDSCIKQLEYALLIS